MSGQQPAHQLLTLSRPSHPHPRRTEGPKARRLLAQSETGVPGELARWGGEGLGKEGAEKGGCAGIAFPRWLKPHGKRDVCGATKVAPFQRHSLNPIWGAYTTEVAPFQRHNPKPHWLWGAYATAEAAPFESGDFFCRLPRRAKRPGAGRVDGALGR
jgi:hypothetical protein